MQTAEPTPMPNPPSGIDAIPFNWPVVGLLLFMLAIPGLPALYLVSQLLVGPPADGSAHGFVPMHYFTAQVPVVIHGISGFLFFITAPFQFSPALRTRHLKWHKTAGKLGLASAYILALSGIWIINFVSIDPSLAKYTGFHAVGFSMMVSLSLALISIKRRNIQQHRAWMMRGVAIPLGGVTPLLVFAPITMLLGPLDSFYPGLGQLQSEYDRWLGMLINLAIVEYVLLRERLKLCVRKRASSHAGALGEV